MPNPSIEVREAVLTDAPEVVRLFRLLGHELPLERPEARLAGFVESGDRVLVAVRASSEQLLGAVAMHITPVIHRPSPVRRFTAGGGGRGRARRGNRDDAHSCRRGISREAGMRTDRGHEQQETH